MTRIVVTGPESSGKTTLVNALHHHFGGERIEEYARLYLNEIERPYEFDDLNVIAENHLKNIINSQKSIQIIDTDFVLMKIWYDDKFGKTPLETIRNINEDIFDLHILCAPDIPWEPDPLREDEHNRDRLFQKYIEELDRFKKQYIIVEGDVDKRLMKSIQAIQAILK